MKTKRRISLASVLVSNPKRRSASRKRREPFPFYAGYGDEFAQQLIQSVGLPASSLVLDPWNGSGTTTFACSQLGVRAIGLDLNPVMVVVGKARLLAVSEQASLLPLAVQLLKRASKPVAVQDDDPLLTWLCPQDAGTVRSLERQINRHLVHPSYTPLSADVALGGATPIATFFYVALFRALRACLSAYKAANPTWIKKPRLTQQLPLNMPQLHAEFLSAVQSNSTLLAGPNNHAEEVGIKLADSRQLPLADATVDLVVGSPPYCTRIDYGVASSIELAILGIKNQDADQIRRRLIGSTTVEGGKPKYEFSQFGETCSGFLERVAAHPSVASQGYYLKSHVAYYEGLSRSIAELARVTRSGGGCVLVIQDSYYKELHNDVQQSAVEIAATKGFELERRVDFATSRSIVELNKRARKYVDRRTNVESVLCFQRR